MFWKRIEGPGGRSRIPTFRLVAALALVAAGLVAISALGGLGYAASSMKAVKAPVVIIKKIVVKPAKTSKAAPARSKAMGRVKPVASDKQYEPQHTICHVPPGNPNNPQTLTLSESGAQAHLRNHELDYDGPCTSGKKK